MKQIGILLIAVGVFGLVAAVNMDTTLEVPGQPGRTVGFGEFSTYIPPVPSQRVHNLGLMDQRRTWLVLSGFVFVGGLVLLGFGVVSEQTRIGNRLGNGKMPTLEARKRGQAKALPPKFDEWGNPLPQPEPDDETAAKPLGSE